MNTNRTEPLCITTVSQRAGQVSLVAYEASLLKKLWSSDMRYMGFDSYILIIFSTSMSSCSLTCRLTQPSVHEKKKKKKRGHQSHPIHRTRANAVRYHATDRYSTRVCIIRHKEIAQPLRPRSTRDSVRRIGKKYGRASTIYYSLSYSLGCIASL